MLVLRIAVRYLLALRKSSTVQVLSLLSFFGIMLGSMAMLVVLSGFNGFEGLLRRVYHNQDPDFRILPVKGRFFTPGPGLMDRIRNIEGVAGAFEVIQDKASLQYGEGQMVVEVLGVDPEWLKYSRLDTMLGQGRFELRNGTESLVLLSAGIRSSLQVNLNDPLRWVKMVYPRSRKIAKLGAGKVFNQLAFRPAGVVNQDEVRAYIPLEEARRLMEKPEGANHFDIFLKPDADAGAVRAELEARTGSAFRVLDEDQQHADLFRIMKIEKLFVFLALGFIILISTFNLFVSCTMLVLDKTRDLRILTALGFHPGKLRQLVRVTGYTLTVSGLLAGLLIGLVLCEIQDRFGLVPLGMSSTFIQSYPVEARPGDFLAISAWVLAASFFALWVPGNRAASIGAQVSFRSE